MPLYEDATELTGHAAMRRSLFHMTSELEDRTDKSLHGVRLSFASHTTRNARTVLQHSAADNETGTRRRLDCNRLLWQTDRSGQPCRTTRRQFLATNTTKSALEVVIRVEIA